MVVGGSAWKQVHRMDDGAPCGGCAGEAGAWMLKIAGMSTISLSPHLIPEVQRGEEVGGGFFPFRHRPQAGKESWAGGHSRGQGGKGTTPSRAGKEQRCPGPCPQWGGESLARPAEKKNQERST